jgi:hypothetical protein
MIEKAKIKDGKKEYNIKGLSVQEYLDYIEYNKTNKDGFKTFEWVIKKCLYRVIELRIFGKSVWSKKIFDFSLSKIDIAELEKFQDDLYKVIFGEVFLHKIRTEGAAQDITKSLHQ